ncbi:hypothetical protein MHFGQ_22160 [Moorella humiferrea]|uniref:Uncharacterized protein n=1 Tax=Neomoorella humiferrea TaxID=676965 RepID=A0A2T0ALU4_9FIRM|nr:hypothetical protein MOHU_22470 [Moorella humiferrea]
MIYKLELTAEEMQQQGLLKVGEGSDYKQMDHGSSC